MRLFSLAYYNNWNIGFVESPVENLVSSNEREIDVHWLAHNYKDRFFADPFLLYVDSSIIRVLVEDFPYYDKLGLISLLTIDRKTYKLLERKVILKQPYHMSFPNVYRDNLGQIWVMPEASMSGCLYRYKLNSDTLMLEDQELVIPEPLLDPTIVEFDGNYWLFCTKAGAAQNSDLYVYRADSLNGPWLSVNNNPVVSNPLLARPAGHFIKEDNKFYRIGQRCDHYYGEAVEIMQVDELSVNGYKEHFVKEIRMSNSSHSDFFHTLNGVDNLCVVDGIKKTFAPCRRLVYETMNYLNRHKK